MTANKKNEITIACPSCKHVNVFRQAEPYHTVYGDQGFLYNDAGNLTLVWSKHDPAYVALMGGKDPWILTPEEQAKFEKHLLPAPAGGNWRFSNPPKCRACGHPIGEPMGRNVFYYLYEGSIDADCMLDEDASLSPYLKSLP